jgi:2'-5' RNA ligase
MWYKNNNNQKLVLAKKHTSVIVAFWLPKDKASKLVLRKEDVSEKATVEKIEDLHLTLLYIGKADDLSDKEDLIKAALESISSKYSTVKGKVRGLGMFAGDGETKPFYASYDSPELSTIREELVNVMESIGIELDKTHGFTPHITLSYLPLEDEMPNIPIPDMPLEFDKFVLSWADKKTEYHFS